MGTELTHELGARAEEVLGLAAEVAGADGVEAFSEQTLLDVRRPGRPVRHVLADEGGRLVGYAQVQPGGSAELAVLPRHRRRGVGRALLDAVRTEPVAVWAHGDLPAARALAAAAGMSVVRELLQMAAELPAGAGSVGDEDGEAGVVVDTFEVGTDEDAWVRLNARAFADHPEQGRMSVEDLRAREAEDWFDPTLLWFARPEPGGAPAASMWVKVVPGEDSGEIYALGVDPDAQGQGLGRLLTRRALAEMARRDLRRATLYVEGDNHAALRTYEREGFRRVAADVQYR